MSDFRSSSVGREDKSLSSSSTAWASLLRPLPVATQMSSTNRNQVRKSFLRKTLYPNREKSSGPLRGPNTRLVGRCFPLMLTMASTCEANGVFLIWLKPATPSEVENHSLPATRVLTPSAEGMRNVALSVRALTRR